MVLAHPKRALAQAPVIPHTASLGTYDKDRALGWEFSSVVAFYTCKKIFKGNKWGSKSPAVSAEPEAMCGVC